MTVTRIPVTTESCISKKILQTKQQYSIPFGHALTAEGQQNIWLSFSGKAESCTQVVFVNKQPKKSHLSPLTAIAQVPKQLLAPRKAWLIACSLTSAIKGAYLGTRTRRQVVLHEHTAIFSCYCSKDCTEPLGGDMNRSDVFQREGCGCYILPKHCYRSIFRLRNSKLLHLTEMYCNSSRKKQKQKWPL